MWFQDLLSIQICCIILCLLSQYNVKEITGRSAKFNGYFRYAYRIEIDPEMFFIVFLYYVLHSCYALAAFIYHLFFFVFSWWFVWMQSADFFRADNPEGMEARNEVISIK